MQEVTLALACLLGAGFIAAKIGQYFKLPSVTGYILAGLALGPSGLGLVNQAAIGNRLDHFTQIALMLIAFGIGEHLELKRLKPFAKSVSLIGIFETSGAFLLVGVGTFFAARLSGVGPEIWGFKDYVTLAILLGAVSVATAPAATLHVMREMKASGPLTSTLMAVVAVDDGLAIMFFGVAVSLTHQIVGAAAGSFVGAIGSGIIEISGSLLMGLLTGLLIDFVVHRLDNKSEMLTAGLALLLLCGETARLLHFSPLLAGMAAGFTVINRDRRDVRVFRAINTFEPPVYVLFFTLAGAFLHMDALIAAGWVGGTYFIMRTLGKMLGAGVGAHIARAEASVQRYLGLALMPQAGVAIGLVFLINSDPSLEIFSSVVTPVVLAGVVLSELAGPISARLAVERAGEANVARKTKKYAPPPQTLEEEERVSLAPWSWEKLAAPQSPNGAVVFGASHLGKVAALARISTIIAYHYQARPLMVRVLSPQHFANGGQTHWRTRALFDIAEEEVLEMGNILDMEVHHANSVAEGILASAAKNKTWAIILGHPLGRTAPEFTRVVERVASRAACPVVVVRFAGILHSERILVPVVDEAELETVAESVLAMSRVGQHQVTLMRLLAEETTKKDVQLARQRLKDWSDALGLKPPVNQVVKTAESRLETILKEADRADMVIMAASQAKGLSRLFFGSLGQDVAEHSIKPVLLVHGRWRERDGQMVNERKKGLTAKAPGNKN